MRRLAALLLGSALTAAALTMTAPPASAAETRLMLSFASDSLVDGSSVHDSSAMDNDGRVRTEYGGRITAVTGWNGTRSARFPAKCWAEPCGNALISVADDPSLDPGYASFEWGVRLRLSAAQTADGENLIQKGLWGNTGGQWKLQVDKDPGRPSCLVSGYRNGTSYRVIVRSSVGVADDAWHAVTCRRTSSAVEIYVDGVRRGIASMPAVNLSNGAAVTIGAKSVTTRDNDQYHGTLDDVFMRVL